jgi:hypothetical protein
MQEKSVLDNSLRELQALYDMAPANERDKIDATMAVIRAEEMRLNELIMNPPMVGDCTVPTAPPMNLSGQNQDQTGYGNGGMSNADDAANHAAVGAAHAGIIRAAFACDLIRVASFQWSPGTNHVSFKGANPNEPNVSYMHHPLSHQNLTSSFYNGSAQLGNKVYAGMTYVQAWYFRETAKFVDEFRKLVDPLASDGASLLDRTVITAISEIGNPSHDRNNASALIMGGSKLGMQPGGFQTVSGLHHNSIWVTVAQAFLGSDPLSKLQEEVFFKGNNQARVEAIPGIWQPPAA